jgi:macrolide transport system ATP-binding/permease protein
MGTLWQDFRYGVRTLLRTPAFACVAILTLGLGIGVNTGIFSVVNMLTLRPLPVRNPSQLTVLAFQREKGPLQNQFSYPDFQDIRAQSSDVFSDVMGYDFGVDGLSVNGRADRIMTNYVTGNYFTLLGLQPALGRLILPSEGKTAGADPVLVLGYSYWKSHFGGDRSIVGRAVQVNGHPVTIVGVAPASFHGVYPLIETQGYLPYGMRTIDDPPADFLTDRGMQTMTVFARLKPGVSLKQAQAALNVIATRLSRDHPDTDKGISVQLFREVEARPVPDLKHTIRNVSVLFLILAGLVLLLACVNVANILLVRATTREREMAVRVALGAGRGRLVRQLLTESVLLALGGGAAGILLGSWASRMLGSIHLNTDLPVHMDFSLDWRVLGYAVGAALLTGIVVGLVPALRATRCNLSEVLHEGGRTGSARRHRLRSTLVVAQVGGSLMLLIVAGLFIRSLQHAQRANLGFDPDHVVNLSMDPHEVGYNEAQGREFFHQLLQRVRGLPGVEDASLAFSVPFGYYNNTATLHIQGYQQRPGEPPPDVDYNTVSPSYFRTMRIPIVRGRAFTDADGPDAAYVAVVNEAMAQRFWPDQDPLGRTFTMDTVKGHSIRVVGVTRNFRTDSSWGEYRPYLFVPRAQNYNSVATLQVRSQRNGAVMMKELEGEIHSLAPGLPVVDVQSMRQALDSLNGFLIFEIAAAVAGTLGILGLILAVVGVYGVVSYSTSQRTHEIGIRMALGAQPADVLGIIFRQGLLIVGIGVVLGLAAAFAIARLVANFLVGVSATDPLTYAMVSAALVLAALAACYLPARRAMRLEPTIALRHE